MAFAGIRDEKDIANLWAYLKQFGDGSKEAARETDAPERPRRRRRRRADEDVAMIKDLVVNLGGGETRDFAADYAISMAQAYGAHVVGVAFVYEPVIPGSLLGGIPTDLIEVQREENAKAAKDAVGRFRGSGPRPASVSAETPPARRQHRRRRPIRSAALRAASILPSSARRSASKASRKSC